MKNLGNMHRTSFKEIWKSRTLF